MGEIVLVKKYNPADIGPVDTKEVLRYAGQRKEPEKEVQRLLKEVINESKFSFRVAFYRTEGVAFRHTSKDLEKLLTGCHSSYIFAATLGVDVDRMIAKYSKTSPTKALLLDALGTERIEALCDKFFADMRDNETSRGNALTKRFSPGYGDLALEHQKDICKLLDSHKLIGVSLNESLLMSPSKSVTAVMGVKKAASKKPIYQECFHKCEGCKKTDCEFRGR